MPREPTAPLAGEGAEALRRFAPKLPQLLATLDHTPPRQRFERDGIIGL